MMIDLGDLKKENRKFKITLFLSYILFVILILGGVYLLHVKFSASESIQNFKDEVETEASHKQKFYNDFYEKRVATINSLSQNKILLKFIKNGQNDYEDVESLFKTLMQSSANCMQLRYIDKSGNEIIRVDRRELGDKPLLVKKQKLQNKSTRYYYKACCAIDENEVWFSKIDLNVEHNTIEKPIKPVLRVAKQVYLGSSYEGFIIINIFMQPYLKRVTESSIFDLYLVDKDGYFLIHKDSSKNWSKYLGHKESITEEFKITKEDIKSKKDTFSAQNRYFIQPLSYKNSQEYRLVYLENAKKIEKTKTLVRKRVFFTVFYAILIAIPFAYISSSPAKKIYQSLNKKSNDLKELADNLERRVEQEIEKNRTKDRLLENQAKLAALGEMIGNIAHQWRHPITRVSLILQNMKTFKSLGKLSDEQFEKYINSTLEQMDYMSQTIDDFKNFYLPDTKISTFSAKNSIEDACKIIGATIKHEGINIIIETQKDFCIKGYKNQFSQVILNIMHNAREALEEQETKSPYIKIKLSSENSFNKLLIEDNAGGINHSDIDQIFDAYFTTKLENGTGIGLYMSKMIIVENFGGTLHVKNVKHGALFSIKVPSIEFQKSLNVKTSENF